MIDPENTMALLACLLLLVFIGYQSEKTKLGSTLSAPLIILLLSFVVGNLGILPNQAPLYSSIQAVLVPLAIPMLLFSADLRLAFRESRFMLFAFLLAVAFTLIGAVAGAFAVDMGAAESQLVGVFSASYIGGSANFVATAVAVNFSDSSLYTAALTADALGAMVFLTLLMALPAINFVAARFKSRERARTIDPNKAGEQKGNGIQPEKITEVGVIFSLLLSAVICTIGLFVASLFPFSGMFIIAITLLSLMVANFMPAIVTKKIQFDYHLGTIFMYVFFATIGFGADLGAMVDVALPMVAFLVILVLVHIILLVWLGARFKFSLAEMMIASSACILGPAAAAALAASKGWRHLVTPGMLVGVLGYAIATFIGITITTVLS